MQWLPPRSLSAPMQQPSLSQFVAEEPAGSPPGRGSIAPLPARPPGRLPSPRRPRSSTLDSSGGGRPPAGTTRTADGPSSTAAAGRSRPPPAAPVGPAQPRPLARSSLPPSPAAVRCVRCGHVRGGPSTRSPAASSSPAERGCSPRDERGPSNQRQERPPDNERTHTPANRARNNTGPRRQLLALRRLSLPGSPR